MDHWCHIHIPIACTARFYMRDELGLLCITGFRDVYFIPHPTTSFVSAHWWPPHHRESKSSVRVAEYSHLSESADSLRPFQIVVSRLSARFGLLGRVQATAALSGYR